ncbi:uncharacterized protein IUM83_18795 [Phytophthora cinnamomi]|uniref:uncharacterized protein n=1 Tax=Phytophthora cinnamomi TaxID=4785 RepID=UPI00355A1858|nr:hypothetical protein IUM83_18795 [Phytophthora cinnamomi]
MVGSSRAAESAVNSALRALGVSRSSLQSSPGRGSSLGAGSSPAAPAPSQSAVSEDESAAESTASSATVVLSSPELGSLAVGDAPSQASLDASAESSASLATSPAVPSDTSLVDVPVGSAAGDSVSIQSSELAARCSTSSAKASRSTTDDSLITVSREALEQIVTEASAEASERVIAVLGPRLDLIGRLNVTLHQGPNIRGDRHVGSRLAAARSLEDVVAAAQPNMGVHDDINLDLAVMRGQLHSAEAARAAAENSAMKESFKHENTMVFLKQASAELEHSKKEVKRLRVLEAHYLQEMEGLRGAMDAHTETAARLENRVRVADDECKRMALQLTREQTVFKAAVASSTAQSKRLHDLLARLDAGDDSSSTRLQRRNEDLQEQVKRLMRANRTLRAHVKFEDMDPDVLVLISEGLSTGELNWDLLDISHETRRVLKDMLANADPSRTEDAIAVDLARAAFLESDSHVELSSEERSAEANKTTPGTRAADIEADRALCFSSGVAKAGSFLVTPSQSVRQSPGQETSPPRRRLSFRCP